ncbi:MAG: hypothetical protein IKB34_09020 [Clostridia bacterium]|nr:hypothetical protein [Clostridia bacterium]
MKDQKALAYVNLYALLGTLPELCRMDSEARTLIEKADMSIGFKVHNGPAATLIFKNGECRMVQGVSSPKIIIPFKSAEKFNGMIDGTVTPVPTYGIWHAGFLMNTFKALTDIMEGYLRPAPERLEDESFFEKSTVLMLGVVARSVCALGNHDEISRFSASNIVDGDIKLGIKNGTSLIIRAKDHRLKVIRTPSDCVMSFMEFRNIRTARALFDGKLNAVAAVGMGDVTIGGMVSQVDNLNRILDRVSEYLA